MAKDPAFLFYSSDFLTGTMFMSNEQVGKYIRLLCAQHQKSGRLTREEMLTVCGGAEEKIIFEKFLMDNEGNFYNERLDLEIQKRRAHSDKQRENVGKRWKKYNGNTTVLPTNQFGKPLVIPLENETENVLQREDKGVSGEEEGLTPSGFIATGIRGVVHFDAEKVIKANLKRFETVCMKTYTDPQRGEEVARKYHLWLSEREQYPKTEDAIFAGFEKWLMNEKAFNNGKQSVTGGNKRGTSEARVAALKEFNFGVND